jgi:plastocyanin
MRRIAFAVALITGILGTGVALAQTSDVIVGGAETYSQPTYNAEQGAIVPFQNGAGGYHNVTARQNGPDGKPLFRSDTTYGGTSAVNGTQYLTAGDYSFFCTVHPTTMRGTLHVTGAGAALARPSATLKLRTKTISKAVKKGLLVSVTASTKVSGAVLTAKLGKATVAQRSASLAAGAQNVKLKLSKAGKSKLRKKSKAKITLTADIPFGSPATGKAKLK